MSQPAPRSLIAWFAANPVAANLLMLLILIGGMVGAVSVEKEVFPRFSPQKIQINAEYPGAGPVEIEESLCVRIEEAVYDLPGVQHVNSEITEGNCEIVVAVLPDHDKQVVMAALRSRVQAIPRLPKLVERIDVHEINRDEEDGVIWVALRGPLDPVTMQRLGDRIQADLARIPGVSRAYNYNPTAYEIAIEVSETKLRQYQLSLGEVAAAIRRASLDLGGGVVKSPSGEMLLRVNGKATDAASLRALVLRSDAEGGRVTLGDIAKVRDGLEEEVSELHHNGETGQGWEIYAEHDTVGVAARVRAYVADQTRQLPQGVVLSTWWDDSESYQQRIHTLIEDGVSGFLLVCLVLTLFLRVRVALWAGVGILTSIFGALWLMPALGVSLNMLSLFGFLLAMGILVDDAIIIGENIYKKQQAAPPEQSLTAAIAGVREVALPVIVSVLIALVAFLPGLFLPGWIGRMTQPISVVMLLTLVFSLVEALLILPAHLAAPARERETPSGLARLRAALNQKLDRLVERGYRPLLAAALDWRYSTLAGFLALLILSGALVASDRVRQSLEPDVTKDAFWVYLTLPKSSPYAEARAMAAKLEQTLFELCATWPRPEGKPPLSIDTETIIWEHAAGMWLEFSPEDRQRIVMADFIHEWRRRIGDIGAAKIDFLYRQGDVPYDLEFAVSAADPRVLAPAVAALKRDLAGRCGVYDVVDSTEPGKPELRLSLKPQAERLGLSLEDLALQVRAGYYGEEAQRFQRGGQEVKVMVRHPLSERQSLEQLRALPVQLPGGALVPLGTLAEVNLVPGYNKLVRQDRRRVVRVQGRVDPLLADSNALYAQLEAESLPRLRQRYPGLAIDIGQDRQEQELALHTLARNTVLALLLIYALIAVPFRSYLKPLIFLLAAPVAWSGAVWAHWLAGLPLSMESMVGMIAASGVVVNDSLVLLDHVRESDTATASLEQTICAACADRFRPILLAFLTNFAGFLPTLLETSAQAQFLIPMTLSLSAGLLFGMAASLILTPVGYVVLHKHKS